MKHLGEKLSLAVVIICFAALFYIAYQASINN